MAISPLDVQAIVAVIRQQMVPAVTMQVPGAPATVARPRRRAAGTRTGKPSQPELGSLVTQRVAALRHDDPERGRKAFRIFLECVLIAELGEALINNASFYQMLNHVQREMERDERVAAAIREATAQLLSEDPLPTIAEHTK